MTNQEGISFIKYALQKLLNQNNGTSTLANSALADKALDLAVGGTFKKSESFSLTAVFDTINQGITNASYCYKPVDLSINLNFPIKADSDFNLGYAEDIFKQVDRLDSVKDALRLLQIKASYINCGIAGFENVSLYQQVRISLALFQCLQEPESDDNTLLMIGADVSGVQSYLYNIISTHASKNLKGRSFYIQLLTENILHRLLSDMGQENDDHLLIYNSGGGFYLLAPNQSQTRDAIKHFRQEIQERLYHEHGGELYVALDYIEVKESEILASNGLSTLWQRLSEKLSRQKRQRYDSIIRNDFDEIFSPKEVSTSEQDAITGELIGNEEQTKIIKQSSSGDERKILRKNYAQIELAKQLNQSQSWSLSRVKPAVGYNFDRPDIGVFNIFRNDKQGDRLFNVFDYKKDTFLFGGNYYPSEENGSPITFDKLPQQGFQKLGVLRMDVDGLGQIFIRGFEKQGASFSKYAELSSKLDLFFKGYLNVLHSKTEERKHSTYIVYSGGDDLFIVGDWKELIDFAFDIESEFKKWTCHHPQLSISGGISIINKSYPIMKAADLAGHAEEQAKNFKDPASGKPKNAFCLFDIPFSWNEKDDILQWKNLWLEWLGEKQVSKSLLYKFLQYRNMKDDHLRPQLKLKWQWMATYTLARQQKDKRISKSTLDQLQALVVNGKYNYRLLDIACIGGKWAELELR